MTNGLTYMNKIARPIKEPLVLRSICAIFSFFFPRNTHETHLFPPTLGVDRQQAEFFQRNGYLVKRNTLSSAPIARTADHAWALLSERFKRYDPSTWNGLVTDSLCELDVRARHGHVKFRQNVRQEPWLYDMIEKNPCIRSTVEAMIGPSRTAPLRYIRGLYPVLPCKLGSFTRKRKGPHTDGHRFLVGTFSGITDLLVLWGLMFQTK